MRLGQQPKSSEPQPAPSAPPLPVEYSTRPIVAYRWWDLSRSYPHGYRLASGFSHEKWPPHRRMEAACRDRDDIRLFWAAASDKPRRSCDTAPVGGCACGIYAQSDELDLPAQPSSPFVVGEVWLWGRVLVCTRGYRAQYAYPKNLVVVGGSKRVADSLELAYGVPCEVWD